MRSSSSLSTFLVNRYFCLMGIIRNIEAVGNLLQRVGRAVENRGDPISPNTKIRSISPFSSTEKEPEKPTEKAGRPETRNRRVLKFQTVQYGNRLFTTFVLTF